MDGQGVVLLSTIIDSCVPRVNVKQRVKGQKEKVTVPYPVIVKAYNQGMKGTDAGDQLKVTYEIDRSNPKNSIFACFLTLLTLGLGMLLLCIQN